MNVERKKLKQFQKNVLDFYKRSGRGFTWRNTRDPYEILVSEIMLQQTQVSRVAVKYPQFLAAFPHIEDLAKAPFSKVLTVWSGMGYNRRARTLREIAISVAKEHDGKIPQDRDSLIALPGVGQSTAGALLAFAFDKPSVFIETNIRRVFIHHFAKSKKNISDKELMPLIEACAQEVKSPRIWYWALMDYGSHLAKVVSNPNMRSKHYKKQSTFKGSNREIRGGILRALIAKKQLTSKQIAALVAQDPARVKENLEKLKGEGILTFSRGSYMLAQ